MSEQQIELDQNIKESPLARFGVTKPFTIFVLICVIIILGVFAFSTLKMELYPNMNLPYVVIMSEPDMSESQGGTNWQQEYYNYFYEYFTDDAGLPDAIAKTSAADATKSMILEVTQLYSRYQEEYLQLVNNVKTVQRMSMANGASTMFIEFSSGTSVDTAAIDIMQAMDRIDYSNPFAEFTEDNMPDEVIEMLPDNFAELLPLVKKTKFTKPLIMKLSPDLLPVFVLSSTYKVGDADGARFYTQTVIPALQQAKGVATVSSSLATSTYPDNFTMVNGEPAVNIRIQKASNAVTTESVASIIEVLESIKSDTNGAFEYLVTLDQGEYIEESINNVLMNLIIGGILAILIIFVFLRSWKMTLSVAISMPLSVVATFVLMYFMGIGLNIVSMSGLALAIGMLVDNSIIVLENIFRLRQKGMSIRDAAVKGASQILNAVIAATLTTICVFFPMFFVTGLMMEIFMDLVWVIIFALLASLIIAVSFLPSIVSSFKIGENGAKEGKKKGVLVRMNESVGNFLSKPKNFISKIYNKVLNFCIRFKWATLATVLVIFGGSIGIMFINGFVMMPAMDTGEFSVTITVNNSYTGNSKQTATALAYDIGGDKQNDINGLIRDVLGDNNVQDISITYNTGGGIESILSGGGITLTADIVMAEKHKLSTSQATQDAYNAVLAYVEDAGNGYTDFVSSVSMSSSMASLGADNVVVTLSAQSQTELEAAIEHTWLALEANESIMKDVVKIENSFNSNVVSHTNKRIVASLTLTIREGISVSKVQSKVDSQMAITKKDAAMTGILQLDDGFSSQFNDTVKQLIIALAVGLALVYLVMVAMFQSFKMPFIVLITVPLAFTGGLILLAICGLPMSVAGMVGLMILMGVVVNNGIVMIDYINQARRDGASVREAVIAGANTRARPILMTATSTIIALIPLAFGLGASGAIMQPVAIVAIGGLVYATFMSLFAVPAFYSIFVRDKKKIKMEVKKDEKVDSSKLENEQDKGAGTPVLPRTGRKNSRL